MADGPGASSGSGRTTRKFRTGDGRTVEFATRKRSGSGSSSGKRRSGAPSGTGTGADSSVPADAAGAARSDASVRDEDRRPADGNDGTGTGTGTGTETGVRIGEGDGDRGSGGQQADQQPAGEQPSAEPTAVEAERVPSEAPRRVGWRTVTDEQPPAVGSLSTALAAVWDFLYRMPNAANLGDHWPLTPGQAKALGVATEGCMKALPQKSRQATVKQISRWIPWISLASTAYIITYPRVLMTQNLLKVRGAGNEAARGPAASAGAPDGEAQPAADGTAHGVRTWADVGRNARTRH